ncbi:DsbA family protein [Auraticoccus cholistanensis]|nr:thioredoxin domain-containing protein [Auraticoccus cholistanensis]
MTKRTQVPKAGGRREQLRQQAAAAAARRRRNRILVTAVSIVVAAVLVVGVVVLVQGLRGRASEVAGVVPPNANAERSGIVVNPGVAAEGAPVFALYQDYQCPACKSFEDNFGPTVAQMAEAGEIQLEYRTMTFLDTNLRNDASFRAGVAAACADVAGHYSAYHDVVYANQPAQEGTGYSDHQLLTEFPEQAGITGDALSTFKACYRGEDTASFVRGTDAAAGGAGVTGTPTITVDGQRLELSQLSSPEQLPALVQQLAAAS